MEIGLITPPVGLNLYVINRLGAYIEKNRFDQEIAEQQAKDKPVMIVWDGMSAVVDRYFEGNWESRPTPNQGYPTEILGLLRALNTTRAPSWLAAESLIRTYGDEGRKDLAEMLAACRTTLEEHQSRFFQFVGSPSVFVWLQRRGTAFSFQAVKDKASAAALATNAANVIGILAIADATGDYDRAETFLVDVPVVRTAQNASI